MVPRDRDQVQHDAYLQAVDQMALVLGDPVDQTLRRLWDIEIDKQVPPDTEHIEQPMVFRDYLPQIRETLNEIIWHW